MAILGTGEKMIDAHCHIEMFKGGRAGEVVEESRKHLQAVVDSITEYRKFHVWKSWELLEPYFGFVFPTLATRRTRQGGGATGRKLRESRSSYVSTPMR